MSLAFQQLLLASMMLLHNTSASDSCAASLHELAALRSVRRELLVRLRVHVSHPHGESLYSATSLHLFAIFCFIFVPQAACKEGGGSPTLQLRSISWQSAPYNKSPRHSFSGSGRSDLSSNKYLVQAASKEEGKAQAQGAPAAHARLQPLEGAECR